MDARTMKIDANQTGSSPQRVIIHDENEGEEHNNFIQAFYSLNLPQKMMELPNKKKGFRIQSSNRDKNNSRNANQSRGGRKKKDELTTTFDQNNKFHMVEKIELSNYVNKNFSRAAFREFLESIADMRCLKSLVLSNNGIDDTYLEEISKYYFCIFRPFLTRFSYAFPK